MARLRSVPSVEPAAAKATATTTRTALREKTNITRSKAPVYENDGNTEDLVKIAKPRRGRPKKVAQNEDELVMGGALEQQDAPQTDELQKTTEVALSEPPMTTDELAKSDGPPPPSAKPNGGPPRVMKKAVRSEAQSKAVDGLKKLMEATARGQLSQKSAALASSNATVPSSDQRPTEPPAARRTTNPAGLVDHSEFSLSPSRSPSPPPPGKPSSVTRDKRSSIAQVGSALRLQSTPGAETTILALKNFKRRPRQPSMLAMVQQRTMSARPSLANATAHDDATVFDLNAEPSEIDDDFAPEAEGTPVAVSRAKPKKSDGGGKKAGKKAKPERQMLVANPKKRKSDEAETSSTALETLRNKRQRSFVPSTEEETLAAFQQDASVQVPSSGKRSAPPPQDRSDVQVINSSPSSTPPTDNSSHRASIDLDEAVSSTETQQEQGQRAPLNDVEPQAEQDDVPNGTMAEPASSPPRDSVPVDRSAPLSTQDILAPPLTQPSPPRRRERREKQKPDKKVKPLSTATLQSLLPKRRQRLEPRRRKTEYDISSASEDESERDATLDASHLDDDEDGVGGRLRRQTKKAPAKGKKSSPASKRKAAASTKSPAATRKNTVPPPRLPRRTAAAQTRKKSSKRYSRATTTSDKENAGYETLDEGEESVLPETPFEMSEVATSRELEEARRKFAEIDEFEMEFESMSAEEHRSSSQGWR